ncbi:MAG: DUF2058 domain-containing protein [Xanthomonadaceae bacterium]|nr:DUF2058 domain-containing protein [Xanthomonadaceae bacterium]
MANSLRDQLIKAGLAVQAPAKAAGRPEKSGSKKPSRPRPATKTKPVRRVAARDPALEQERRELRAMEQARIREEKQAQATARATQQRREAARVFLLDHRHNDRAGDIPFHFQAGERIRRLFVTATQRQALLAGELRVAVLGKRDFLITPQQAEEALVLDPGLFVFTASPADAEPSGEGDPYQDYPVPDDLMW